MMKGHPHHAVHTANIMSWIMHLMAEDVGVTFVPVLTLVQYEYD